MSAGTLAGLVESLLAASKAAEAHAAAVTGDERASELTGYVTSYLGEVRRITRVLAAHHAERIGHAAKSAGTPRS